MNLPFAPIGGAVLGLGVAGAFALMPGAMLEGLVMDSGLPAILAGAEPPLGTNARLMLAGGAGAFTALFVWFGLFILLGSRGLTLGTQPIADDETVPVLRRADAHPDAPARAPLLATRDLGTPFLEVTASPKGEPARPLFAVEPEPVISIIRAVEEPVAEVEEPAPAVIEEQELPVDLEQPLAAFDPHAILETPMPPAVAVPPLRPRPAVFDASERFETFELTPMRRPSPPRHLRPAPRPQPQRQMETPVLMPTAGPAPAPVQQAEAPTPEPIVTPRTDATIHALLERLEKGVVRRGVAVGPEPEANPRTTERGLEDALVTLRNLARRA